MHQVRRTLIGVVLTLVAVLGFAGSASADAFGFGISGTPGSYAPTGVITCSGALETFDSGFGATAHLLIPGGTIYESSAAPYNTQYVTRTLTVQYYNFNTGSWVTYQNYFAGDAVISGGIIIGGVNYGGQDRTYFGNDRISISPNLNGQYVRIGVTYTWYSTALNDILSQRVFLGQESYFFTTNTYVGPTAGPGYCRLGT